MLKQTTLSIIATLMIVTSVAGCSKPSYTLVPNPTPYVRYEPTEYYLYLPANYSSDRAWPVFVGVHGFGGSGLECLSMWQEYADAVEFILVCPSLSDEERLCN